MRTRSSGWLRSALLICNAQETGASGVVAKTSAIPSPVGRRVSLPAASAARNESVSPNNLVERMQIIALLIDQQLGVTDNVDEEDMRDLELDLFLNFTGHR